MIISFCVKRRTEWQHENMCWEREKCDSFNLRSNRSRVESRREKLRIKEEEVKFKCFSNNEERSWNTSINVDGRRYHHFSIAHSLFLAHSLHFKIIQLTIDGFNNSEKRVFCVVNNTQCWAGGRARGGEATRRHRRQQQQPDGNFFAKRFFHSIERWSSSRILTSFDVE